MYISTKDWKAYISKLRKLNDEAAQKIVSYVQQHGFANTDALIRYCYSVVEKYGTGSAALSAAMYDATALMQGAAVPAAEMASLASYGDVAKTVHGVLKTSSNVDELAGAVARWVKKAGCDTTLQNAVRDSHSNTMYSSGRRKYGKKANTGAQFAWIPSGDTCAFCLALAANGWQYQTRQGAAIHAEHIHSNCDCTYAVRFDNKTNVKGYNPEKYREMYYNAEGKTPQERINSMRRIHYQENRDKILAQKKANYAEKNGLSAAAGTMPSRMSQYIPKPEIRKKIIEEGINRERPIFVKKDDLLLAMSGATVGKTGYSPDEFKNLYKYKKKVYGISAIHFYRAYED